jgi:uracil-DNA glycosylase family 4
MPTIDPCLGCPYRFSVAIGPRGNPASRIVLVGEAPGTTEIIEGEPFRGAAGAVLWRAANEARLLEGDLFVTNAVACRPPHGAPAARAIAACHGRLVRDIEAHPRAVVVALGLTAVRAVTGGRRFRMSDFHGVTLATPSGPMVPTFHQPASSVARRSTRFL